VCSHLLARSSDQLARSRGLVLSSPLARSIGFGDKMSTQVSAPKASRKGGTPQRCPTGLPYRKNVCLSAYDSDALFRSAYPCARFAWSFERQGRGPVDRSASIAFDPMRRAHLPVLPELPPFGSGTSRLTPGQGAPALTSPMLPIGMRATHLHRRLRGSMVAIDVAG